MSRGPQSVIDEERQERWTAERCATPSTSNGSKRLAQAIARVQHGGDLTPDLQQRPAKLKTEVSSLRVQRHDAHATNPTHRRCARQAHAAAMGATQPHRHMSSRRKRPARPAPSHSPRAERSRERILRAASELLAQTGEFEVAGVAQRAGVSVGLPFRYFESKSGLLAAVVDDFQLRLAKAVVYHDFAGTTWQERERQRVSAWVHFLFGEPIAPVMLGGLGGDSIAAASWQKGLRFAVETGARNIARGQRDGDLPKGADPMILAAAVLGGVQAAVGVALASKPRPDRAKVAKALWHFVRGAVEYQAPTRGKGAV